MIDHEIHKTLVMSTAHISEKALNNLDGWPVIMSNDHTLRIYVQANQDGLPEEVSKLLDYADNLDCDYLLLDSDGPFYPDLKVYDW